MANSPLGLMSTCRTCDGSNKRTGNERLGPMTPPAFGTGPGYRIRSEEYACTSCDRRVWGKIDAEEEPR